MNITCAIKRHEGPPSDEHIIPSALGGMLTTTHVCETCNNNECAKIDSVLTDDPIALGWRFNYRTPGWENVKDKVLGRGVMDDGTKVIVRFDEETGIFRPTIVGKPKTVVEHGDGRATVSYMLTEEPTAERLLDLANREYRRRSEPEIGPEQLHERVTLEHVEIPHPTARHEFVSDLVGLNLAGLKIAYEFTVDTLGLDYLADPRADRARDLLIAGIPKPDDPQRENFQAMGSLTFAGAFSKFPWHGKDAPPGHFHLLGIKVEANQLLVIMRIFDAFEGGYLLSDDASRFGYSEGPIRVHWVDVVEKRPMDHWNQQQVRPAI